MNEPSWACRQRMHIRCTKRKLRCECDCGHDLSKQTKLGKVNPSPTGLKDMAILVNGLNRIFR